MVSTEDFESFNLGSNPGETIETPNRSIWGRIAQLAEHQSYELNVPISIIGTTKGEKILTQYPKVLGCGPSRKRGGT